MQRVDLENYVEEQKEIHLAQAKEKARVDAALDDHHEAHGGGRMEARKPVSFKSADVPQPDTVAFNCEYTI